MSDTFTTIFIILIASILIFVVPVVTMAKRNDVSANQVVQAAVAEFVDETRTKAYITEDDYVNLKQKLEATGNVYDVRVSIQYLDENPAKKTSSNVLDSIKIGENVYYIEYTTQIEEAFRRNNGATIKLSTGDYIKIEVKNENQTLYENFRNVLYQLSGGKIGRISGLHVGLIIDTSEGKQIGTSVHGSGGPYVISYNVNEAEGGEWPAGVFVPEQTKNHGEDITLTEEIPVNSNPSLGFSGWKDTNTGGIYPSGGIYRIDASTEFIAIWTERTFSVSYYSEILGVEGLPDIDTGLRLGDTYTIWGGRSEPTLDGYDFEGWINTQNSQRKNSGDTITISENVVFYAKWTPKNYIVEYNKNASGQVNNMPASGEQGIYNEKFTISNKIPTRTGYKFLGWSNEADGEVQYKPGEEYYLTPYGNPKVLYAIWGEEHTLKYNANIRVLVVGYKNASWVSSAVNHLNTVEELSAEGITIAEGEFERVVERKNNYDVIIVNASAWALNTIDSQSISKIKEIAKSVHLITFGNDERNIPLIENTTHLSNIKFDINPTDKGNELVGLSIAQQSDSSLASIRFKSDVTVLYTGKYYSDSTGELKGEGDVIGVGQYITGNNWIHGQISKVSNELLEKLVKIAINGTEFTGDMVQNMPENEIRGYREDFNLSSIIPTRYNSTFMGWSESKNGDAQYEAGAEFTMPDEDKTLYAVWGSKLEFCANTTVLIVEYNKPTSTWLDSVVNYFNSTGQFIADGMKIGGGELERVVAEKDNYDLIIINASAWSASTISSNGRSKLNDIARSTHLITLGNDETNIPLIDSAVRVDETRAEIFSTEKGRELIGEEIGAQTDSALYTIRFKSDVTVLYVARYLDRSNPGEYRDAGDIVGFRKTTSETNWIHGSLNSITQSFLYKLSRVVINGLEKVQSPINNMPRDRVYKHNAVFNLPDSEPTRKGSTFKGWAETPDGEVKYLPGKQFIMPRGHKKLYAVWD